jgi:hypothetical protein
LLNKIETISRQICNQGFNLWELMMVLRCFFMVFALLAPPAFAYEATPWFGSEASQAEQISLSSEASNNISDSDVNSSRQCPIAGCPITDNIAK